MQAPNYSNLSICYGSFQYLRSRIIELLSKKDFSAFEESQNILVSRKDSSKGSRKFQNDAEFEVFASQQGFVELNLSSLSPIEIMGRFFKANTVMGVHGAGLLNSIFCKVPPRVIEITDFPDSWITISLVHKALGFEHLRIKPAQPGHHDELPKIDLDKIKQALDGRD